MDTLNLGTIELYSVELGDRFGSMTDLSSYSAQFKIITDDEATVLQDWTVVENITDMRIDCLIDTTGANWADGQTCKLYIKLSIPPETPIFGPFMFQVS